MSSLAKFAIGILFFAANAFAAIPKNNSALLLGSGSIRGGVSDKGFGLMAVKNFPGKNGKIERLVFDIGSPYLTAIKGAPGYFHIENDTKSKRVVIQFQQTVNSKFNEAALKKAIKSSPFIKQAEMYTDTSSQTTSIVLNLRRSASLRAIPLAGKGSKTAQLNLDLFEETMLPSNRR